MLLWYEYGTTPLQILVSISSMYVLLGAAMVRCAYQKYVKTSEEYICIRYILPVLKIVARAARSPNSLGVLFTVVYVNSIGFLPMGSVGNAPRFHLQESLRCGDSFTRRRRTERRLNLQLTFNRQQKRSLEKSATTNQILSFD